MFLANPAPLRLSGAVHFLHHTKLSGVWVTRGNARTRGALPQDLDSLSRGALLFRGQLPARAWIAKKSRSVRFGPTPMSRYDRPVRYSAYGQKSRLRARNR
jgi:hypothetical protein